VVLPAWAEFNLAESLRGRFGVPVFMDNDANLGAVAEHWWGEGRGLEDFAYIKVATGVGAGYMIRGEIYRGATGVAGEIGHVTIDPSGTPCVCGNRGCLATFVGADALLSRARELAPAFPGSPLSTGEVTMSAIEDAAMANDPLATTVVREAANQLGSAIAGVLNLMNPGAVIIGGGLSRLGERLVVPVREAVMRRTLVSSVAASEISTSELGPRAIALGAATQVLSAALTTPHLFPGVAAV
jgi:predicted NBD/HSP70 family sugar kinase